MFGFRILSSLLYKIKLQISLQVFFSIINHNAEQMVSSKQKYIVLFSGNQYLSPLNGISVMDLGVLSPLKYFHIWHFLQNEKYHNIISIIDILTNGFQTWKVSKVTEPWNQTHDV